MKYLFYLLLMLLSITNNINAQSYDWEYLFPKPTNQKLWDVYFSDDRHGWAVGEAGAYVRTTDGINWTAIDLPVQNDLWSVFFIDSLQGWICGLEGLMMSSSDGGLNWSELNTGTTDVLSRVFFLTDQVGWVIGGNGTFMKTTNAGQNWQSKNTNFNGLWRGLYFIDENKGFIAGEGRTIKRTLNGGTSWHEIYPAIPPIGGNTYFDIWFCDSDHGYIALAGGALLYSTNGGANWDHIGVYTDLGGYSVTCAGQSKVWTVNGQEKVIYSYDGGHNFEWQEPEISKRPDLNGIHFSDALKGWTVGDEGAILYTQNGGTDWMIANVGYEWDDVFGLDFTDNNNGFAATRTGHILHTQTGGIDWDVQYLGAYLYGFEVIDGRHLWAAASEDTVFYSRDGGAHWTVQSTGLLNGGFWSGIIELDFVDSLHGFALTFDDYFVYTSDGGQNWTAKPVIDVGLPSIPLWKLHFVDPLHGWIIGSDRHIYKTADGGLSWNDVGYNLGGTPSAINFIDSLNGWMVGWGGIASRTTDGGFSWEALTTGSVTSHLDVQFLNANNGWAVGYNSLIYTSDGGDSWQEEFLSAQADLIDVFFLNSLTGWVAGKSGTIMRTSPCQASSTEIQSNVEDGRICSGQKQDADFWMKSRHTVYVGGESPDGPFGDFFYPAQVELRKGDTVDFVWVGTGSYNVNFDFIDQYDYLTVTMAPNIHTIVVNEPTYHFFRSDPQANVMEGTMTTKYKGAQDDFILLDGTSGQVLYFGPTTEWLDDLNEGEYCLYMVNHDSRFYIPIGQGLPQDLSGDCYEISACFDIEITTCYQCDLQATIDPQTDCVDPGTEYLVNVSIEGSSAVGPYDVNGLVISPGGSLELYFNAGDSWTVLIHDLNVGATEQDSSCFMEASGSSPEICIYPIVVEHIATKVNAKETKYVVQFEIREGTGNYLVDGNSVQDFFFESDSIPCGVDYSFEVTDDAETNVFVVSGDAPCTISGTSDFNTEGIRMYPNPVKNKLYIDLTRDSKLDSWQLLDAFGTLIEEGKINGHHSITLDLSMYSDGYYLISINNKTDRKTIPVVLQK